MMRLKLTTGTELNIHIKHSRGYAGMTTIEAFVLGNSIIAQSYCHSSDQFCKATGRKIAGIRLLDGLQKIGLTKNERRSVFFAVCPQYGKTDAVFLKSNKIPVTAKLL